MGPPDKPSFQGPYQDGRTNESRYGDSASRDRPTGRYESNQRPSDEENQFFRDIPNQRQSWAPTDERRDFERRAPYQVPAEEALPADEILDDNNLDLTDSPAPDRANGRRYYYRERERSSHRSHETYSSHTYQRSVSTIDEVTDETPGYLASFLVDRMLHDGREVPEELLAQQRTVRRDVAKCLQQIGDDLTANRRLNTLIGRMQVTSGTAFETFASVAAQIFDDGKINWGRIVTLFYFAYELAKQVLFDGSLIKTIIGWVVRFISERLAKWISDRGGWSAIKEYFGSTPVQMMGVFVAGMLATWLVFCMKGK